MSSTTVVWDWNGTLIDDRTVLFNAVRDVLVSRGTPPPSNVELLTHFERPMRRFLERLCGGPYDDATWSRVRDQLAAAYRKHEGNVSLAPGATCALRRTQLVASQQFLATLAPRGQVMRLTATFGIGNYFTETVSPTAGLRDKTSLLTDLIERYALDPASIVHIGDTLDDVAAARAVGALPILVTGATLQPGDPIRLHALGPLVATTLKKAVDYLLEP